MLASIGAQLVPVSTNVGEGPLGASGGRAALGAAGKGVGAILGAVAVAVMAKGGVQPVRHSVAATTATAAATWWLILPGMNPAPSLRRGRVPPLFASRIDVSAGQCELLGIQGTSTPVDWPTSQ
jgi:hypothetical protein